MFFLLLLFSVAFSVTAMLSLFRERELFPLACMFLFLSIFTGIMYAQASNNVRLAKSLLARPEKCYTDDVRFINSLVDDVRQHPYFYACINKSGLDYVEEERDDRH